MIYSRNFRRISSFFLGLGAVATVELTALVPAQAVPLEELIFRGIQLFQLSSLSTQDKVELGEQIHQQVLRDYELSSNPLLNAYVDRIGQSLAAASDCSDVPFRFFVVEDPSINAFATTGGFVYINTGLIQAADNQAQVAGVLAHEIGHICNDDLVDQLQNTAIAQGVASLAGLDRNTLAALGYRLAIELPYSRQVEFAADAAALGYVQRVGYDPYALPAFLSKLLERPSLPVFLSNHPAPRDRIAALERKIAAGQS